MNQAPSPVLYLSGIDGTPTLFLPTADQLRAMGHQVLLYDHSALTDQASCPSLEHLAAGALALLDEHGITRAVVLGESFGGPIALTLARHHPDRVQGLVLVATFAHLPFEGRARLARWLSRPGRAGRLIHAVAALTPGFLLRAMRWFHDPSASPHDPREFRRALRRRTPAPLGAYLTKACLALMFDARPWLTEIAVPGVVLCPTHDRLIPPACSRELARLMPDARLLEFAGAGHVSHTIHPEWITAAIEALPAP